jgi:hypothetical protein
LFDRRFLQSRFADADAVSIAVSFKLLKKEITI